MDNNIKPLTLLEISEAARRRVTFISKEFENGFEFIKNYPRSVTFFGSARIKEDDLYYKKAEGLASRIVKDFHYSFSRKVCLAFSAEAYIFFPGGFGTLDEFLEILTLVQTNKIPKAPIILIGTSFWNHLELFFREVLLQNMSIEENDLSLYTITDNEDEILEIIKRAPIRMGLKYDENLEKVKTSDSSQNDHGPLSGLFKKISW